MLEEQGRSPARDRCAGSVDADRRDTRRLPYGVGGQFEGDNRRIENGDNKHIKIAGRGDKRRWTLIYPSEEEPINSSFYGQLPSIGMADLLRFGAEKVRFLSAFTPCSGHLREAGSRSVPCSRPRRRHGDQSGLWKMAEGLRPRPLDPDDDGANFMRAEKLHAANDAISNATAALPMFNQYDIDGLKHSSSDTQRLETQIHTINARHGSKYFGLKKAASAYTLVVNHCTQVSEFKAIDVTLIPEEKSCRRASMS
jgi:hypothetical protein